MFNCFKSCTVSENKIADAGLSLPKAGTVTKMAVSKYKLTYFDIRSRGEPIRLLFALAKIQFEDSTIAIADWPKHKSGTPWGSLPLLEVDGIILAQHCTIGRFLARRFNLAGRNEIEQAKCDEIVDAATDLLNEQINHQVAIFFYPDEKKAAEIRKNLVEVSIPKFFAKFDAIIAANGGNYMVGNQATWADAWIANVADRMEERFDADIKWELYPNLKRAKNHFLNLPGVKEHIAKRPAAQL